MTTQSRTIALITYLLPFVGPLGALAARREDQQVRYHATQALAIDLGAVIAPLVWAVVAWVLTWVPRVGALASVVLFGLVLAFEILLLAARPYGAYMAYKGHMRPAPVVGGWAERQALSAEAAPAAAVLEPVVEAAAEQPPAPDVLPEAQQVHTDIKG